MITKGRLREALAAILEKAKCHRDFSDSPQEIQRWVEIVEIAYYALGEPSMAELDELKRSAAKL